MIVFADSVSKKKGYHEQLGLSFTTNDNGMLFQDNVFYKNSEINILKNSPDLDYHLIHHAKKIFEAEVVENE